MQTDVQTKYEAAFLAELAECRTMEAVKELISDTWSPEDIFANWQLQEWAERYADPYSEY